MSMLISVIATIPRSLSVINIEDIGRTTIGGLDHVFKGEYKRQPVALKALSDISHEGVSRFPPLLFDTNSEFARIPCVKISGEKL